MNNNSLRKKIVFTLVMLFVYRFGSHLPLPAIDQTKLAEITKFTKSGIFSVFNTFSGGAINRMSIFALSIMPYITSSIVMQLLSVSSDHFKKLKSEFGEKGNQKIQSYTRYLTIFIAMVQGISIVSGLFNLGLINTTGSVLSLPNSLLRSS